MIRLSILDRYVMRQVLWPMLIALALLTLTFQLRPLTQVAEALMARGIATREVAYLMWLLVPQVLALTLPLSMLAGVLVAFARMSSDSEYVAMQACGVGLFALVRPVAVLGVVCWSASAYVSTTAAPAAAREFREHAFRTLVTHAQAEVRPRVFISAFPGRVIYVRDIVQGQWADVFIADFLDPRSAAIYVARRGRLVVDMARQRMSVVLEDGQQHMGAQAGETYDVASFKTSVIDFNWAAVFPPALMKHTVGELRVDEIEDLARQMRAAGFPSEGARFEIHRRTALPLASFVCALLGLALGASTAGARRLAGFTTAGGVVIFHYVLLFGGHALAMRGYAPAWVAAWIPIAVLALMTLVFLIRRARGDRKERRPPRWMPLGTRLLGSLAILRLTVFRAGTRGVRTLDMYVARVFAGIFAGICVVLLVTAYVLIMTDLSPFLIQTPSFMSLAWRYCLLETPQLLYFVLPVATLVAALITVGALTYNSELVVMKACGISLYRAVAPLFVIAAVSSAALFALQERVLPDTNSRAEQLRATIRGRPDRVFRELSRAWVMGRDGAIYHYTGDDFARRRLSGVSVFELHASGWQLRSRMFASQATASGGGRPTWTVDDGYKWHISPQGVPTRATRLDRTVVTLEPIDYFRRDAPDAERMTYTALSRYIEDLRRGGTNVAPYLVSLRRKTSFPFITVVMMLLAVPFGVTIGRRGALYGVSVAVMLSFGYWTMMSVFGALGGSGAMMPLLAAWAPNLLFAAAGGYLVLTTRT